MLWIALAGGIRVEVDGVGVDDGRLGGRQGRRVLARLAWEGRPVHRDELADGIWLSSLPRTWERTLSGVITRLRAGLADAGVSGDVVTFTDGSYVLVGGGAVHVDVRQAACELVAAREAAAREAFHDAQLLAESVLAVCRLPLLPGDDAGWVDVARTRHRAALLGALDVLADVGLRAGWYVLAEGAAREAVHCEPLREAGHQRLLTALTAQGDLAAVMSSYAACRRLLAEALGVSPSPETERIYRDALGVEPNPSTVADGTPGAGAGAVGTGEPFPPTLAEHARALVGRESELVWLWSLWRRARADAPLRIALDGPAGSGKRSLAAVFAKEVYAGGVTVVHRLVGADAADGARTVAGDVTRASLVVLELAPAATFVPLVAGGAALVVVISSSAADHGSYDATLTLSPLDRASLVAIAEERLGRPPSRDELNELWETTGGWPGAIHERLNDLAEQHARRLVGEATQATASLSSAQADLADEIMRRRRRSVVAVHPGFERAPYKGLLAFEPEDADLFVGREQLVADLLARLWADRLVVVLGGSGSGKTSVMRAGVIAELRRGALPGSEHWPIVIITPGHRPLERLASALRSATGSGSDRPLVLIDAIERNSQSVVVVDQFEELFTLEISPSERMEFVKILTTGVNEPDRRHAVAIVVRADFFDELSALLGGCDIVAGAPVVVRPPTELELRRIVSLPARAAGGIVEPGLVDVVIADARAAPGALPLVSTALLGAWNRRVDSTVTIDAYRAAGGVTGAIARLAEDVWSRLDPGEQRLARSMLLRLRGGGVAEYSNPVQRDELAPPADPRASSVLDRLVSGRLVTVDDDTVRLAHEALPREWPRFEGWLADDRVVRDGLHHLRRSSAEWERRRRDAADLYRGTRLAVALEVADAVELSTAERTFLDASVEQERTERHSARRRRRRIRTLGGALAAVLVLAAVAGSLALARQREAADQTRIATAERLTRAAESADGLDLRLLLAVEARRLDDSPEARGALLGQLGRAGAVVGFLRGDAHNNLSAAAVSPDGRSLATGAANGSVSVWRLPEAEPVDEAALLDGPVTALGFAADGELAAGGANGAVARWTPGATDVVRFGAHTGPVLAVAYRRDGDLVSAGRDGLLRAFSRTTGSEVWSTSMPSAASIATFDRNGTRYAQIGDGGELTVFDLDASGGHKAASSVEPSSIGATIALAMSPDGRTLALGDRSGDVRVLDLDSGDVADLGGVAEAAGRPEGSISGVDELVFVRSRELLATAGGAIVHYDLAGRRVVGAAQFVGGRVTGLAVDPNGTTAAAVTETGDTILLDLERSSLARPLSNAGQPVTALAVDAGGTVFAAGDGQVAALDGTTGRRRVMPTLGHPVTSVSTSGGLLGTGGRDVIRNGGQPHGAYIATTIAAGEHVIDGDWWYAVTAVAVQPGGALLGFGDDHGQVRLVEPSAGGRMHEIHSMPAAVTALAFTATGDELVGVAADGTIVRWDTLGRPIGDPIELGSPATALTIAGDGRTAAVATAAGAIVVDLATGDVMGSLTSPFGGIDTVAFGLDGEILATGGSGRVLLWDVASGRRLGDPLPAPDNTAIAFDSTGRNLVTGGADGEVVVWEVDPDRWVEIACELAGRTITRDEWARYLGDRAYDPPCP